MNKNFIFPTILVLVFIGVAGRVFPHIPNATPITAITFASSIYLGKRWSILIPISVLLLSDMVIGFYDWKIMLSVYGSFVIIGCSSWMGRKHCKTLPIFLAIFGSSLFFFLITNATVWAFSPWYQKSISGLLYSYELGIPFFRNMLIGDIAYSFIILGAFELFRVGAKIYNQRVKIA